MGNSYNINISEKELSLFQTLLKVAEEELKETALKYVEEEEYDKADSLMNELSFISKLKRKNVTAYIKQRK